MTVRYKYSSKITITFIIGLASPIRAKRSTQQGFSLATGEIFCWLNSDDKFAPNALRSVALEFMQSSPDMVAGICEIFQDDSSRATPDRLFQWCLSLVELLDLDSGWNAGQFHQPEVFFSRPLGKSGRSRKRRPLLQHGL